MATTIKRQARLQRVSADPELYNDSPEDSQIDPDVQLEANETDPNMEQAPNDQGGVILASH
jgi:hypothetical protein